jgi:glycosyltransferase involved in cell wall biosynthesis
VWPIVGCIGRLSEQKAQYHLVDAISYLTGKYPQIKLIAYADLVGTLFDEKP